jgi:hypothetical protein
MEFDDDDKLELKKIMDAFEKHFIGEVNATYERYNFNQRKQEIGESFDVFVADLRRLARSCDYGVVEEPMIRNRIVVGIRDDATRRKLLQMRQEAKQELRWSTLCLFNQMYFSSRLDSRVLIKHAFYLTKKIITDSEKFFSIYVQYHIG